VTGYVLIDLDLNQTGLDWWNEFEITIDSTDIHVPFPIGTTTNAVLYSQDTHSPELSPSGQPELAGEMTTPWELRGRYSVGSWLSGDFT